MKGMSIDNKSVFYTDAYHLDEYNNLAFGSFYAYSHHVERLLKTKSTKPEFDFGSHVRKVVVNSFDDYHVIRSTDTATDLCHLILLKKDTVNSENKTFVFFLLSDDTLNVTDFYNKLNSATNIPIMDEWRDYIFTRLVNSAQARRLKIDNAGESTNLELWRCSSSDTQILNIVSAGLELGDISIHPTKRQSALSESIGLDAYLTQASEHLTSRIQEKFTPRFNPVTDSYSKAIMDFEDWCYDSGRGIQLFDAQKSIGSASVKCLDKEHRVIVVGEMGVGM